MAQAPAQEAGLVGRVLRLALRVIVVALLASFFGVYLSFFIDSAPAPTIVLLMTVIFIGAYVVTMRRTARAERVTREMAAPDKAMDSPAR